MKVRISATPSDAELSLDGQSIPNPFEAEVMISGKHRVQAKASGHRSADVTVPFDRPQELALRLERLEPAKPRARRARSAPTPRQDDAASQARRRLRLGKSVLAAFAAPLTPARVDRCEASARLPRVPGLTYRDAGVDIDAGDGSSSASSRSRAATRIPEVLGTIGGFAGLCALPTGMREPVLVSGTDGVGTKLKLAFVADRHTRSASTSSRCACNDVVTDGRATAVLPRLLRHRRSSTSSRRRA